MVNLDDLDDVDWESLDHAHADDIDIPERLRALLDPDECQGAGFDLWVNILHQGTIYPATIPAMRFVARIAADPAAAGRLYAADLLTAYAESVAAGWTTNPHYLPAGTDMVAFDRDARQALDDAVTLVTPVLADADPDCRAWVAQLLERLERPSDTLVEALHTQLAAESDNQVRAAVTAALNRHGGLREDEHSALTTAGDDVRFAAAWSALAAGAPPDGPDATTAIELWTTQVAGLTESGKAAVPDLLKKAGPCLFPLFARLTRKDGRAVRDGVWGLHLILGSRRDLYQPAVNALLELAGRIDQVDADAHDAGTSVREALVDALVTAAQGTADPTLVAEALYQVVRSAPSPDLEPLAAPPDWTVQDVRANAVPTLVSSGHPCWPETLTRLVVEYGRTPLACWREQPGELGGRGTDLTVELQRAVPTSTDRAAELISVAVAGLQASHDQSVTHTWLRLVNDMVDAADPEQAATLAALAATSLPTCHDPDVVRNWLELVAHLPDAAADRASEQTMATLAAIPSPDEKTYPHGPWNMPRSMVPFLVRQAWPGTDQLLTRWLSWPRRYARWAQLGLGVLRGEEALVDEATSDGLRADRSNACSDFVDLAVRMPSPGLLEACRSVLDGTAGGDVAMKVAAARFVASHDGLGPVWPTLLAAIDYQQDRVGTGAMLPWTVALELLSSHVDEAGTTVARTELIGLLQRSAAPEPKHDEHDERGLLGPVRAAGALLDLGAPDPERDATHALGLLEGVAQRPGLHGIDDASRVLVAAYPELAKPHQATITASLRRLRSSPDRIASYTTDVADDVRFTDVLDAVLVQIAR